MKLHACVPVALAALIVSGAVYAQTSPSAPTTTAAAPSHAETVFWGWAKNSRDPNDVAAYLNKYPHGAYVAEAQARIAALKSGASATDDAGSGAISAPPAGKGQIVFFRPWGMVGMAVWFKVRENGAELGKLSNGAYFVRVLDPGKHTFSAATENHDTLNLELDDGETLYVKGGLSMGLVIGEARLTPSDSATFQSALGHMHTVSSPASTQPAASSPSQ